MSTLPGDHPQSASGNPRFDYAPGQPNHFRIMRHKQELVRSLGPENALAAFRETFGWPRTARLRRLPVESERVFAAAEAEFFHETGVAGVPFVNDPPPVIGEGMSRPLRSVTRSQYVACLRNARTRGRAASVLAGGRLLLDFQPGELERVDEEFSWDPAILHHENGAALYLEAPNEDDPIRLSEALNLLGAHADFFGHWMCEYLPKLGQAVLSGRLPGVPILIDSQMPPSHRRSIELLFPEQGPIVEVPAFMSVLVDRLWVVADVSYYPLYDAGTGRFEWDAISVSGDRIGPIMADFRNRAATHVVARTPPEPRVFLARKPSRHRRLVNDEAIYAEARRRGFIIIFPEDLTFDQQIGYMQGARRIIVPDGSAVFIAQFAAPGAEICMLSHPMNEPMSDFNAMFRMLGIRLTGIVGPVVEYAAGTPHDSSYRIDVPAFTAYLDGWLASS